MMPVANNTISTSQTYLLLRSPQQSGQGEIDIRISVPPMVGVPAFTRCVCGTIVTHRLPHFQRGQFANHPAGPSISEMHSEVAIASTVRRVR